MSSSSLPQKDLASPSFLLPGLFSLQGFFSAGFFCWTFKGSGLFDFLLSQKKLLSLFRRFWAPRWNASATGDDSPSLLAGRVPVFCTIEGGGGRGGAGSLSPVDRLLTGSLLAGSAFSAWPNEL